MPKKAKKTAKKGKKKAAAGALYQLKIENMGGAFNVIAATKKQATRMFRDMLKVKRLPAGAKVTKSKIVVGKSCRIIC